ncbi:SDR family NAD(P)-dependent oxidoreductase [Paucibacter sp. R3-3]|uniref:SDR family NAD(P)-dependent oxidoreductase n=1 Tax=Roseateles agri TaxID=3098619 RepID=A0ABU5DP65_9BURK|nr:SDR family NAD(P)-dependent oxidoreductase [Paucibacter sp. R3-3]MDY0748101.1 SDR family NAD(P)-dependent oxidoreductase [Paucibacter sp. R3-3]
MTLSDKVILVTGANRGIGAAIVREILKTGVAKIYAAARTLATLPSFTDSRVVPLQLDINDDASVRAAAAVAKDVDVLINNAGSLAFGDYISSEWRTFEDDMQTNFFGTLRVLRAFTPQFISRKSGTIANISSVVGLSAIPVMAGYSASKAALHSLTQSLRGSMEKHNITVLGIYPGPIETELSTPVPYPDKATPEHAAINIVKGIVEGQTYIFPDPMAQQAEQLWSTDNRKLEHRTLHLGS